MSPVHTVLQFHQNQLKLSITMKVVSKKYLPQIVCYIKNDFNYHKLFVICQSILIEFPSTFNKSEDYENQINSTDQSTASNASPVAHTTSPGFAPSIGFTSSTAAMVADKGK